MDKQAIGYIRVSSKMQGKSGLGLEAQQRDIERFCELNDIALMDTAKANALIRNAKYEKVVMDYYRQGDTCYKIAQTLTALGLPTPNGSQQWQALQVKRVIERMKN
jgi:hypothetical protein